MNIISYNSGLPTLANSLFDDFFNWSTADSHGEITPRANVSDHGKNIVVELEMPGATKENIHVSVENGLLKVQSDRNKESAENKDVKYYINELGYGSYSRSFRLNETIDSENIGAKFENGILTITLNKKEAAVQRKIEIQ